MTNPDRMAKGYEPDFDIDYEIGQQGELFVKRIVDSMGGGRHEVKTDEVALRDMKERGHANVFLEYECRTRGGWTQSGIATTKADMWCHVIGDVVIVATVEQVREITRYYWHHKKYRKECVRGSHPTKAVCIPVWLFLHDLACGLPDGPQQELAS